MKTLHDYTNEQIRYKNFSEEVRLVKETKAGTSYSKYSCTNKNGVTFYEVSGMQGLKGSAVMGYVNGDRARPVIIGPATKSTIVKSSFSIVDILLEWTDNTDNETGFVLERKKGTGSYEVLVTLGANIITYTDQDVLLDGVYYYYRVKATSLYGDSDYSNVVAIS